MYTLYYLPGACSRAVHALLIALEQPVKLVNRDDVKDFHTINPSGQVPVLVDDGRVLHEGAAIILHLLEKHGASLLPKAGPARETFLQWLMFANATLHPAYGRLFFINRSVSDENARREAHEAAAAAISRLWEQVDAQLSRSRYVGGESLSVVDMMLSVYAAWGRYFPVHIVLGIHVERMIQDVENHPAFRSAVEAEQAPQAA